MQAAKPTQKWYFIMQKRKHAVIRMLKIISTLFSFSFYGKIVIPLAQIKRLEADLGSALGKMS